METAEIGRLKELVLEEIRGPFSRPEATKYPFSLDSAVKTLFDFLSFSFMDTAFLALGEQILLGFKEYEHEWEIRNLPDRCESFARLVLKLVKPEKFKTLEQSKGRRPGFGDVLLALGVVSGKILGANSIDELRGKTGFAEFIGRLYVARNDTVHSAKSYSRAEKAEIFQSVVVFLMYLVCENKAFLESIMNRRTFPELENLRKKFSKWQPLFVEITGDEVSSEDCIGIEPYAIEHLWREPDENEYEEPLDYDSYGDDQCSGEARQGKVLELARDIKNLIFIGDPGSGKSTTLQYLAWSAANDSFTVDGIEPLVPVYIPLNRCTSAGDGRLEELILRQLGRAILKFDEVLQGNFMLLLDGLNEIRPEALGAVKVDIKKFLEKLGRAKIILTCRPGAYNGEFGLPTFYLRSLDDSKIEEFIHKRFRNADKSLEVISELKKHGKFWDWARNPLFLEMIIRVIMKSGQLPENKGRLMEMFIRSLFSREKSQKPQMDDFVKETLLGFLAFETRKIGAVSFSNHQAVNILGVMAKQLNSNIDIPAFISESCDNNILSAGFDRDLEFSHELFQEYFAAVEILRRSELEKDLWLSLENDSRWDEPLLMYSGLTSDREEFIRQLSVTRPLLAARSITASALDNSSLSSELAEKMCSAVSNKEASFKVETIVALFELGKIGPLKEIIYELSLADQSNLFSKGGFSKFKICMGDFLRNSSPDTILDFFDLMDNRLSGKQCWLFRIAAVLLGEISLGEVDEQTKKRCVELVEKKINNSPEKYKTDKIAPFHLKIAQNEIFIFLSLLCSFGLNNDSFWQLFDTYKKIHKKRKREISSFFSIAKIMLRETLIWGSKEEIYRQMLMSSCWDSVKFVLADFIKRENDDYFIEEELLWQAVLSTDFYKKKPSFFYRTTSLLINFLESVDSEPAQNHILDFFTYCITLSGRFNPITIGPAFILINFFMPARSKILFNLIIDICIYYSCSLKIPMLFKTRCLGIFWGKKKRLNLVLKNGLTIQENLGNLIEERLKFLFEKGLFSLEMENYLRFLPDFFRGLKSKDEIITFFSQRAVGSGNFKGTFKLIGNPEILEVINTDSSPESLEKLKKICDSSKYSTLQKFSDLIYDGSLLFTEYENFKFQESERIDILSKIFKDKVKSTDGDAVLSNVNFNDSKNIEKKEVSPFFKEPIFKSVFKLCKKKPENLTDKDLNLLRRTRKILFKIINNGYSDEMGEELLTTVSGNDGIWFELTEKAHDFVNKQPLEVTQGMLSDLVKYSKNLSDFDLDRLKSARKLVFKIKANGYSKKYDDELMALVSGNDEIWLKLTELARIFLDKQKELL